MPDGPNGTWVSSARPFANGGELHVLCPYVPSGRYPTPAAAATDLAMVAMADPGASYRDAGRPGHTSDYRGRELDWLRNLSSSQEGKRMTAFWRVLTPVLMMGAVVGMALAVAAAVALLKP